MNVSGKRMICGNKGGGMSLHMGKVKGGSMWKTWKEETWWRREGRERAVE